MSKLAEWMALHEETDQTLAPKVGVSRVQVSRVRRGLSKPSAELALKLEAQTKIPAADFIFGAA